MKKKFLILLSFLLLILCLVGCGKKTDVDDEEATNKETNNTSESSDAVNNGTRTVKKIRKYAEDGNTIIEFSDGTASVFDQNLKEVYTGKTLEQPDHYMYSNGYLTHNGILSIGYDMINTDDCTIMDLKGNTVLSTNDKKIKYYIVSKSGYVIQNVVVDDLNGEKDVYKIVDLKGNSIYETEDELRYAGGDIFYDSNGVIINAKLNKQKSYDGFMNITYDSKLGYIDVYDTAILNEDLTEQKDSEIEYNDTTYSGMGKVLSYTDKYKYYNEGDNYLIVDFDNKVIKEITEGGVKKISYNNKEFAVISNTGYYYTFGLDGKYIIEPVKIEGTYDDITLLKNNIYTIKGKDIKTYDAKNKAFVNLLSINENISNYHFVDLNNDNILGINSSSYYDSAKYGIDIRSNKLIEKL